MKELLSDVAYDRLKEMVSEGRLAPGAPLSEATLSDQLGMSRSPIRTALEKLTADGLVQRVPGRGYFVATISIATVTSVMEIREALEGFAAAHGNFEERQSTLRKLRSIFEHFSALDRDPTRDEWAILARADRRFHQEIVAGLNNPIAMNTMQQLSLSLGQVRGLAWAKTGRFRTGAREHVGIIDALLESNGTSAQALVVEHLSAARTLLVDLMSSRAQPPEPAFGATPTGQSLDAWLDAADSADDSLEDFMRPWPV